MFEKDPTLKSSICYSLKKTTTKEQKNYTTFLLATSCNCTFVPCGRNATTKQNLPPARGQGVKWQLQTATKDQRRHGSKIADSKQAEPLHEWGKKRRQQSATGDQAPSPQPVWVHFVAACWYQFISWPSEQGIKTPLTHIQGGLKVSPPESPGGPEIDESTSRCE